MYILVKDADGKTIQRSIVRDEDEAWETADELLASRDDVKRVIFFSKYFTFVNALSRPDYFKREEDVLSEEDKQALRTLESL